MRKLRFFPNFSLSVALALCVLTPEAQAQNLRNASGPAELPPSSYQGKQYVDSKGCAYIRAGYSGRVSWVPRVSRGRKILCGFRPTLAGTQQVIATPKAVSKTRRLVAVKPKQIIPPVQKIKTVKRTVKSIALPKINERSIPAPKVRTTDRLTAPCVGASSLSSQYINSTADVRCGSQESGTHRSVIREEISPQSKFVPATRSGQSTKRVRRVSALEPPKGYKSVHKDGRLNPLRGVSSTSGARQMALIWSNTVPRYLIDPATGKPIK